MRRALVPILTSGALALGFLAAPASAQVYDRYGGGNPYAAMPAYQAQMAPPRVLTWSGKQNTPAPQMAMPQAPAAYGYPQQAYPQQGYGQQPGYYPSIQPYPQQGGYPAYPQPMPAPGQMPSYEAMQQQRMQQQMTTQPPQPFPQQAWPQQAWPQQAYQPGTYPQPYPQQPYPQQPGAAPVAYPQGAYTQPQPQQFPAQPYPLAAQPAMAAPAAAPRPADPPVTAAPTTPVQSQPLPTNIYAPAPPRADITPGMPSGLPTDVQTAPSGGAGSTALASLDYRAHPANDPRKLGVRHYSVHRAFGMSPDPAPTPSVDNQVIIAAQETEIVDSNDIGLRGVGMDQDDGRKNASDD